MRLIDADALAKRLGELWDIPADWDGDMDETCQEAFTEIDNAPTIEAEPVRHGEWLPYPSDQHRKCSVCGIEYAKNTMALKSNYCPNCGAKMDGKEDEE